MNSVNFFQSKIERLLKRMTRDTRTFVTPCKSERRRNERVRACAVWRVISVSVRRLRAYAVIHGLSQSMLLRQKEAKQNAGKHSA